MTKRYLGNIITDTPTAPTNNYEATPANGVWSLAEAFAYSKAGLWPTAGNLAPIGIVYGGSFDTTQITRVDMSTSGSSTDFGDMTILRWTQGACSSSTRGLCLGGSSSTAGYGVINNVDYVTIASASNAIDFGDLTQAIGTPGATSNDTRGLQMGGSVPSGNGATNIISYCTIASTGNFTDFGDLITVIYDNGCCASPTRALSFAGIAPGEGQPDPRTINYVTIATTGNAADFGDTTQKIRRGGAVSSSTRAVIGGGTNDGNPSDSIEYVTIATTGNGTDFGDLSKTSYSTTSGMSSSVTGFFIRSDNGCRMETVTIATTGNSVDFGTISQITAVSSNNTSISNSSGGL